MRKLAVTVVLGALALSFASGCDDVKTSAFGGVYGMVGQPAIGNCRVEIYHALQFESLDSTAGLIRTGTTRDNGRFAIELPNSDIGNPLIVVARPGPGAMYRDFGAPGNPDVAFDSPREPWVAVLEEWLGGEDYVTVNPITTMAFRAHMRHGTEEVGAGVLRFDRDVTRAGNQAMAANFGIIADPAANGMVPPNGSPFEDLETFYIEDDDESQSYTYAALQLALAANDFAALSAAPTDNALDFYEALFEDAEDGVVDGQYFGTPVPHLNQVPAVVGREANGASSMFRFISTHALTAQQEEFITSNRDDPKFEPSPATMLAIQADATGAIQMPRVDHFDVQNYPFSGNVVLTLRGQGFRRTDRFIFRSNDSSNSEFNVDRESVGVDGEFQFMTDTELRMRIPDFAATTRNVPDALKVSSGADLRIVHFILENRPALDEDSRAREHEITRDARVTDRGEPLLVNAEVGRIDAGGELDPVDAGNNIYPAATDPAALTPGVDDVYELRVRVANPGVSDINGVVLDLGLSAFQQLGANVVADTFGGAAPNRAVIFEGTLPSANLMPGDVVRLDYRFKFLDTAVGVDLIEGVPVEFTPVLSGVSQGAGMPTLTTSDVVGFNRTVDLAPVMPDQTAQLDAVIAPTLPVSVTAGDSFDIQIDLSASPRAGGVMRTFKVTDVEVTVVFDGETSVINLTDRFFRTVGESDLVFTALTKSSNGSDGMPVYLTQAADSESLILTVQTDTSRTGALSASFTATGIDTATGTPSSQTSAAGATTVNP